MDDDQEALMLAAALAGVCCVVLHCKLPPAAAVARRSTFTRTGRQFLTDLMTTSDVRFATFARMTKGEFACLLAKARDVNERWGCRFFPVTRVRSTLEERVLATVHMLS